MGPRQDDLHHYDTNTSDDYMISYTNSMNELINPTTKSHLRRFLYTISFLTYLLSLCGILYHTIFPPQKNTDSGSMSSIMIENLLVILWTVGVSILVLCTTIPMFKYYSKSLIIRARHIQLTFVSVLFAVLTAIVLSLMYWNDSNCETYNYPMGFFYIFTLLPFPIRVLRLLKVFVWKGGINDPMAVITFLSDYEKWTNFQQELSVSIQQQTYDMKKTRQPITCIYCLHGAPHIYATTNHDENCGLSSSNFFLFDKLYDSNGNNQQTPPPTTDFDGTSMNHSIDQQTVPQGISIHHNSTRDTLTPIINGASISSGTPSSLFQSQTPSIRTTSQHQPSLQTIMSNPSEEAGQFSYNADSEFSMNEQSRITQEAAIQKAHAALQDPHSLEARRYMDRINGALYNFKDFEENNDEEADVYASKTTGEGTLGVNGTNYGTNQFQYIAQNDKNMQTQSTLSSQQGLLTPQKSLYHSQNPASVAPATDGKSPNMNKSTANHINGVGLPGFSFTSLDSADSERNRNHQYDFSFGANSITLPNNYGMGTSIPNGHNISEQYLNNNALMLASPNLPLGNTASSSGVVSNDANNSTRTENNKNNSSISNTSPRTALNNIHNDKNTPSSSAVQLQQQQLQFVQVLAKCAQGVQSNHQTLNAMIDNVRHYNNNTRSTTTPSPFQQSPVHQSTTNKHTRRGHSGAHGYSNEDTLHVDLPPSDTYRYTRATECTCLSVYEASYYNEDNQLYTLYDYYSHNLHIETNIDKANEKNTLINRGLKKISKRADRFHRKRSGTGTAGESLLGDTDIQTAYQQKNDISDDFLYDDEGIDPCPLHSYASDTDRVHFQVDNVFDDGGEFQNRFNHQLQRHHLNSSLSSLPISPSSFTPQDYIFSAANPLKQFSRCSTSNIIRLSIALLFILGLIMAAANYVIVTQISAGQTYFCSETTPVSDVSIYISINHILTLAVFFLLVNLVNSVWSIYSSTPEYYVIIVTHLILLIVQIISFILSKQGSNTRLFAGRFFFWTMALRITSSFVALLVTPLTKITQSPTPQLVPVDQDGNIIFDRFAFLTKTGSTFISSSSLLSSQSSSSSTTHPSGKNSSKNKDTNASPRLNNNQPGVEDRDQPKVMKLRLPKQVTDIRVYDLINRYVDDHMTLLTIELHRDFQSMLLEGQHQQQYYGGNGNDYSSQRYNSISSLNQSDHLDSQYLQVLDMDSFQELLDKPSVMNISLFHSLIPQPPPSFDLLIRNPHGYSSFVSYLSLQRAEILLHCYVHTQSILLLLNTVIDNMQYILDIVARYNQHIKEKLDYELFNQECDFTTPMTIKGKQNLKKRPEELPKYLQPMITMQLYQLLTQLLGCCQSFSTLYFQSHSHIKSHPPTITVTHQPMSRNPCPHQPPGSKTTDKWSCTYPLLDCVLCTITPYLSGSFIDANRSLMTLLTQVSQQQVQNLQLNEYTTAFNSAFSTSQSSSSSSSSTNHGNPSSPGFIGSMNQLELFISSLGSHHDPRNGNNHNPPPPQLFATSPSNDFNDITTPEFSSLLGQSSKLPPIQLTTQFSSHAPSNNNSDLPSNIQDTNLTSSPSNSNIFYSPSNNTTTQRSSFRQPSSTATTTATTTTTTTTAAPASNNPNTTNYKPARFATSQLYQPPMLSSNPANPGNALPGMNFVPTSTAFSFIQPKDFSSLLDKGTATSVLNRSYITRNQSSIVTSSNIGSPMALESSYNTNPSINYSNNNNNNSNSNSNNNNNNGMLIGSQSNLHLYNTHDRGRFSSNSNNINPDQINNDGNLFLQQNSSSNLADLLASTSSPTLQPKRLSHSGSQPHIDALNDAISSSSTTNAPAQSQAQLISASATIVSPISTQLKGFNSNMPLIDPEDIPFFYEQYCNLTFFSQVSQIITSLYALLKELETGSRDALCVHYSLYGSQSIHWKLLYYRIITINHWCNILHTCGLTEDLTL